MRSVTGRVASARRAGAAASALLFIVATQLPQSARACEYYTEHWMVVHPWVPPAAVDADAVPLFLHITQIVASDRLVGASTPVAERVELRRRLGGGGEPGPISVAFGPGDEVALGPMTTFLLLRGLRHELPVGRQYPLTLEFEKAGAVEVEFVVGAH